MNSAVQIEQHLESIKELFFAVTNGNATKVGINSTLEGLMFDIAKTGQVVSKDVLNLLAENNIDFAFGEQLDNYALRNGFLPRFGATKSYTYLCIYAEPNTVYLANTNKFIASNGETFVLDTNITIGSIGFTYAKVSSENSGLNTFINPNSITKASPSPTGHKGVWNDFATNCGTDAESDTDFRNRMKNSLNRLSVSTLAQYEQIFNSINNRVLKLFKGGVSNISGKFQIYVLSVNGIPFTESEFDDIITKSDNYLSLTEQRTGIELLNVNYATIDISMRVELQSGIDILLLRTRLQTQFQKKYDFRYLKYGDVISVIDLMLLTQRTDGVKRVLDKYFTINGIFKDYVLPDLTFPHFRSFVINDINGNVISDNNNLTDYVYSAFFSDKPDYLFQQTIKSIV